MKPTNLDLPTVQKTIAEQCPDLRIESLAVFADDGQHNRLLLVNGSIVFRVPRHGDDLLSLRREAQILRHIQGRVPIHTPHVRWVSPAGAELGEAFLAYELLPGRPLWTEVLEAETDAAVRRQLAHQLGLFLTAMHGIEVWDEARTWPNLDRADVWSEMLIEIRGRLFPAMRPDARQAVEAHFDEYLQNETLRAFTPCFRHGDFGLGNILYDPVERTISGIIDFGSAGVGDPAVDLAAASCFGDEMFAGICAAYPGAAAHLARATFYRGTFALQEALHGLRTGDRDAYESGMERYV